MARNTVKLPSFSNVSKGNTATLDLPLGRTYDTIYVKHTGITLAQIKYIVVEVNGKPIITFKDGQALADHNKRYDRNVVSGVLDFHFKRPEMKTLAESRAFSLGTANGQGSPVIQNVTIRMDIDVDATAPVLEATAIQSNPTVIGLLTKVKNFPVALNAGVTEVDNIPRPAGSRIAAIHVVTGVRVDKLEVELDSIKLYEVDRTLGEKIQVDNGRKPQAGQISADFILEGDMLQAIPMAGSQDLRVRIFAANDTPAGSAAVVVVEYFDGLAGI